MKRYDAVIATTHLGSQGERMSREALDSLADAVARAYIPIGIEHDPRVAPQGRLASAVVRERADGEFEVAAVMEVFEGDDDLQLEHSHREIVLHKHDTAGITIAYDWTHRSEGDQADIRSIAALLGTSARYDLKKAADPISVITLAGAFLLGGISAGFLGQIGADSWNAIKPKLGSLFSRKRKGEQLFVVTASLEVNGIFVEVQAILTNPTLSDIETLMSTGLKTLDKVVPIYLQNAPDIRRLVFEVDDGNLRLSFAVRKDCRPLAPTLQVTDMDNENAGA